MTLCKPNAIYRYFNIVIESKLERNILRLRLRIILTNIDRMWSVNVEYVRLMQLICMKFLRRNYNILIRIGGGGGESANRHCSLFKSKNEIPSVAFVSYSVSI